MIRAKTFVRVHTHTLIFSLKKKRGVKFDTSIY